MRTIIATTALTFLIAGSPAAAQEVRTGGLEGTVAPWIASRSVQAAQVSVVDLGSDSSATITALVDAAGHYHLDSLRSGRYLLQLSHPTLDSLDVSLPPEQFEIAAGTITRADHSLPTGEKLRALVCPGVRLGPEKVVVAGRVVDAETDAPLKGAHVVAAWTELSVDGKTRTIVTQGKQAVVSTGRAGEYRLCGLPAVKTLELQIQHGDRASAATRLSVTLEEGVAVRDFSLSTQTAPTLAALDSLDQVVAALGRSTNPDADSTRHELELRGSGSLMGTVRTSTGQPLEGAEVRVRHGGPSTVTNDSGRFALDGLPFGTQVLLVRHLGYALVEMPVELRRERQMDVSVRMTRAVTLDSVRVLASKWPLAEFEYNRRTNLQGRFLTLADIQRTKATKTSDLIPLLGGPVMMGRGRRVRMQETDYDPPGTHSCKEANVVIDGVDGQSVDDVQPIQIAGIELYKNAAAAPVEYAGRADCGLIVIWLRPGPRWHGWRALFSSKTAPPADEKP